MSDLKFKPGEEVTVVTDLDPMETNLINIKRGARVFVAHSNLDADGNEEVLVQINFSVPAKYLKQGNKEP